MTRFAQRVPKLRRRSCAVAYFALPVTLSRASRRGAEVQAIRRALRATDGNRTHAARQLGISLRKLQYRLKEYESQD